MKWSIVHHTFNISIDFQYGTSIWVQCNLLFTNEKKKSFQEEVAGQFLFSKHIFSEYFFDTAQITWKLFDTHFSFFRIDQT